MKKYLKKHEIATFISITFLFSYIFWGILYASYKGIITENIFNNMYTPFYMLGGFMPSVAAIFLMGYFYGENGIKTMLKKLTVRNVKPIYYLFIFSFTVFSVLIPQFICSIIGIYNNVTISNRFEGGTLNFIFNVIIYFLLVLFFGGGVNEEFGWRGFLLPRLQCKLHSFTSSVLLGIIWSLWHIPLFLVRPESYIVGNLGGTLSFIIYIIETIWLTTIFTWLYNRTNGNLLVSILFHAADNTVLSIISINNAEFSIYTIILNVIRLIVLIFILFDMFRNSSNKVVSIKSEI